VSYADVNGVSLYYEEHGSGQPLILLHGGLGSGDMYAAIMPQLAKGRRVITADLQAHGHTADVDRPLRYETMGDDVAGLIEHLGLAQADVMGYSFGAATALRLAIQHPSLVRRLVLTSIPCRRDGWFPESLAGMDQMGSQQAGMLMQSPVYDLYSQVAPRVEDFAVLLDKTGELLRLDYDWSAEVRVITATPTRCAPRTWSSSTGCSAAGCATRTGTARRARWRGWPSCRAGRTMTSSPRRTCPPRSSRSSTSRRSSRPRRSAGSRPRVLGATAMDELGRRWPWRSRRPTTTGKNEAASRPARSTGRPQ
jgi:pimeloyl-ACP methyl ester carboxylesterase